MERTDPTKSCPEAPSQWELPAPCSADQSTQRPQGSTHSRYPGASNGTALW